MPLVILVLLGFAGFFMTFLVAPLAVLTVFYVIFALGSSRTQRAEPAAAPSAGAGPGHESLAPIAAPVRRKRVDVTSLSALHEAPEQVGNGEPIGAVATPSAIVGAAPTAPVTGGDTP